MANATTSFPEPLSPVISTLAQLLAILPMVLLSCSIDGEWPISRTCVSDS
jgi:hypothetical protein